MTPKGAIAEERSPLGSGSRNCRRTGSARCAARAEPRSCALGERAEGSGQKTEDSGCSCGRQSKRRFFTGVSRSMDRFPDDTAAAGLLSGRCRRDRFSALTYLRRRQRWTNIYVRCAVIGMIRPMETGRAGFRQGRRSGTCRMTGSVRCAAPARSPFGSTDFNPGSTARLHSPGIGWPLAGEMWLPVYLPFFI